MASDKPFDSRSLPAHLQLKNRQEIVRLVREEGLPKAEVARHLGVSRQHVYDVLALAGPSGRRDLTPARRGPKPGRHGALTPRQARAVRDAVASKCPEELGLPFALWTAEAVGRLIKARHGADYAVRSVRGLLAKWGFAPQRPSRRAAEADQAAVRRFREVEYPALRAEAAKAGAALYWFDESGIRGDSRPPRGYAPRGKGAVLVEPARSRHARVNVLAAIDPTGRLAFRCVREPVDSAAFVEFLGRLLRHAGGHPAWVMLDNHRIHRSKATRAFVEAQGDRLRLEFIPPYAPEVNPVELLNNDVKTNFVARVRPQGADELEAATESFLRGLQRRAGAVRAYFRAPLTRFAADPRYVN